MYQILGPKVIVSFAAWLAVSIALLLQGHTSLRVVVIVTDFILLTLILSKPVWRFVWRKTGPVGQWLSRNIYPDLNGTYDVTLESNWPIVKRMLDAARHDAAPFDPFQLNQPPPELMKVELEACIDQSWFDITMRMYPKVSNAVITKSSTIATIPLKLAPSGERELLYVFEQENDTRAPTDDPTHLGAARLKVDRNDYKILSGVYWNNRAWQRGVNAAGRLTLRRTSDTCRDEVNK